MELMEADIGDEMVALDETAGSCFGFNAVATEVWRSLSTPKSFDELRERLLSLYDVEPGQCTAELRVLLADMAARGFIDEVS
jgi:hypothetical protein